MSISLLSIIARSFAVDHRRHQAADTRDIAFWNIGFGTEAIQMAMARAESPHRWIERPASEATKPGRFNQCNFRSNAFHEIAAVDAAVTEVLTGRLDPPPEPVTANAETLSSEERLDALQTESNSGQ